MPLTKKTETKKVDVTQEETQMEIQEEVVESTEIAEVQTTAPTVAERQQQGLKQFVQEMAEEGLEGIEIGGFSFDPIRLYEGKFDLGGEVDLGQEFDFQVVSSRNRYVVRQGEDEDAEMFYSYAADGSSDVNGNCTKDKLQEWAEDGYTPDIKRYLEVMVFLKNRDDEYDESPASLSIPPSSLQRFGGLAMISKAKFNVSLTGVICTAKVGARVGSGSTAFRPWNFSVKSLA